MGLLKISSAQLIGVPLNSPLPFASLSVNESTCRTYSAAKPSPSSPFSILHSPFSRSTGSQKWSRKKINCVRRHVVHVTDNPLHDRRYFFSGPYNRSPSQKLLGFSYGFLRKSRNDISHETPLKFISQKQGRYGIKSRSRLFDFCVSSLFWTLIG